MNDGKFISSWILFPSQKKKKKNRSRLSGGGGGGGRGGVHLCFTSASCYVAPYLGLQGTLLPSHKSLHEGLLFIKHVLHRVASSREQRWKSIVTLWPEFTKQYSIHPALNVQYIVQPFLFRKLFTYSTIIKLRTVSFLLISSSILGLKRQ